MIRAYVNRTGQGSAVVVELWQDGQRISRSLCQRVDFAGAVHMHSVQHGSGLGFAGLGGYVHTWVESDADHVASMVDARPLAPMP